jgi:hypothetical protein
VQCEGGEASDGNEEGRIDRMTSSVILYLRRWCRGRPNTDTQRAAPRAATCPHIHCSSSLATGSVGDSID